MSRTVYVVQEQMPPREGHRPKFDLSPAAAWGELRYLLSATANPFRSEPLILELHDKLRHYDPDQDHLLLLGNPCIIGWVVSIAAIYGKGRLSQLQWDGRRGIYNAISSDIRMPK